MYKTKIRKLVLPLVISVMQLSSAPCEDRGWRSYVPSVSGLSSALYSRTKRACQSAYAGASLLINGVNGENVGGFIGGVAGATASLTHGAVSGGINHGISGMSTGQPLLDLLVK